MTLTDVVIANNGNEITTTEGGGIHNKQDATLNRVTLSGNKADEGGGIYNDNNGGNNLTLTNVTVSGNTAGSTGGGLYNQETATIVNSTFTANIASSGGGIHVESGNLTLTNTIVAGNVGSSANADVGGTFVVGSSFNLIGDGTGSSNLVHGSNGNLVGDNLTPIEAMLSPLANNGGFAATHAIAFASPARDGGTTSGAPSLDQRGITRDTTPDIGALELVAGLLIVDTTFDVLDGDTTSVASLLASKGSDGFISLREAIIATNNDLGANTIILGAGTHLLSIAGINEQNAATGDLDIEDELTIIGAGTANTIVDGNGLDRVFDIVGGPTVTIQDLTVQGGDAGNKWGAGVNIEDGGTVDLNRLVIRNNQVNGSGGGVYIFQGTLTMTDTTLSGNSADYGGGFYNDKGVAILNRVTANDNSATDSGGGLYNFGPGANMMLTNVTVSGNSAAATGGGIYTSRADTFTNITVAYNTAATTGGIHIVNPGSVTLKNSIVAFNTGGNANWAVIDAGNNLDSENSLGISGLINTNPQLTALNYNGGFTQTHAITTVSAAYNAGTLSGAPATDQRGEARDSSPDIGAYEVTAILTNTGEFRVNDTTTDQQVTSAEDRGSQRAVAVAGDGSYVVVWSSLNQDGSGQGVYFQRFHATGTAITGELRANETPTNDQQWAHVASAPDGSFVVTWTSNQSGNEDVYFRRFAANGTALTGELLANDTTTGIQKNSSIAMEDNGDFVVTWQGQGPLDANGIHFRRFNADGNAKDTTDKLANTNGTNSETDPVIAMQQSGAFVIGWLNETTNKIHFNRFNSAGSAISGGQIDNVLAVSSDLAVASDSDGNFTFVYRDNGIGPGVWRRGYNADGTQQYGYLQLSIGDAASPSIDMADDGTHVVTWHKSGGAGLDVFAQKFNADGSISGGVFQVNVTSAGTQWKSSIAVLDPENFVVVWSGNGNQSGEVDTSGVFARQFGTAGANLAPTVVNPMINQLATQGTLFSFTFASDTFDDANGDSLLYSATLDDYSTLPTWLTFNENTRTFSGTPLNADVGSLTVRVTASDGNGGTEFEDFIVLVSNTNDVPTDITLSNSTVSENADGAVIGSLIATDPDIGDTHTFSVDDARFEIISTQLKLRAGQSLDKENDPIVSLRITATDGAGLSYGEDFTIAVANVNEVATDISLNNTSLSENADGVTIGMLTVTDPDVGDTHTWSVDDQRFEIIGMALQLKAGESLDKELESSVDLVITATDAGGLTFDQAFTITVANVNESPVADLNTFTVNVASTLITTSPGVLAGDYDPDGDLFTARLLTPTSQGVLVLNADGSFTYIPSRGFSGTDSFTYEAWDGSESSTATLVTIEVATVIIPVPRPPDPVPAPEPDHEPADDSSTEGKEEDAEPGMEVPPVVTTPNGETTPTKAAADNVLPSLISVADSGAESETIQQGSVANQVTNRTADSELRAIASEGVADSNQANLVRNGEMTLDVDRTLMTQPGMMWNGLDQHMNNVDAQIQGDLIVVGAAGAAASSFTVGVVAWAIRTGFLASGLLAQLPAWSAIDPLTIMQGMGNSEDDESLEEMMKRQSQALDE
jgi:Bacterial Ig domain/Putative Ig domain